MEQSIPSFTMPPKKSVPRAGPSKVNSTARSENVPGPAGLSFDIITPATPSSKKGAPRAAPSTQVKSTRVTRSKKAENTSDLPNPPADDSLNMVSSSPLPIRLVTSTPARNTRSKVAGSPILGGDETWKKLSSIKTPPGMFPQFAKLPIEIRLMIWHEACIPRIVGMKPAKIPGIAHACKDSRDVAKYYMKIRDFKTGVFMDPKMDVLLFDRSSFSPEIGYHISAYHTLRCRGVSYDLMKKVERVVLSVAEVAAVWRIECFHCFLTTKLIHYFPNIKEYVIPLPLVLLLSSLPRTLHKNWRKY